jgi:hypothetical protein
VYSVCVVFAKLRNRYVWENIFRAFLGRHVGGESEL